jgi:predicted DNA-binding transcriptional regulator AlpA
LDTAGLPEFLTSRDVALLARTTEPTVRYWRHIGKGPRGFRLGRRVLYARADVEAWLEAARAGAAA